MQSFTPMLLLGSVIAMVFAYTSGDIALRWAARAGILAGLLYGLACPQAQAQTVGLHLGSVHGADPAPARKAEPPKQNNTNPGVYVRFDNGVTLGGYRNTLNRTTVYAGYEAEWGPFGLFVGAGTGYQKRTEPATCRDPALHDCTWASGTTAAVLVPMLVPNVRLPSLLGVTPRVSFIPGLGVAASVVHLSIEARF